jgi:aminocarboxymuconate-semialdehyde decarboxylase
MLRGGRSELLKIDMHSHYVPRDCFEMVDKKGKNYGPKVKKDAAGNWDLGTTHLARRCDPEIIIKDMDKIGLDMRVLTVMPPGTVYGVDSEDGLRFAQRQNNAISQAARAYPDRFVGVATLPMQDVALSVKELDRAVRELGCKAVQILSTVNGKALDEKEFWPFYKKVQELDVPILIHPRGSHSGAADQLKKYNLINLIGNPLETTIAVASIVFGGVLEEFPRLKFVLAHAGGFTPFIRGRWDHGYKMIDECQSIPKAPTEYLNRLYFDTVIHFGPSLAFLVDTVGAKRVVLGSDYNAPMGMADPVAQVRNSAGISAKDKEQILEKTAVTLLKL